MVDAPERAVIFHKPGPGNFVRLEFVRADLVPDARAIREAALREAAALCRTEADNCGKHYGDGYPQAELWDAANAILALIEKEPGK